MMQEKCLQTVVLLIATCVILVPQTSGLQIGFGEVDYRANEEDRQVRVVVTKVDESVADLTLRVTPMTFDQLSSTNGTLPGELANRPSLLDPAEFEPSGKQDFANTTQTVTFPPSLSVIADEREVFIGITDDDINEADEGFFLLLEIEEASQTDVDNTVFIRNGVTLVIINDDDTILLGFEQPQHTVEEDDGIVDDLVFIVKENDMQSEQILSIKVEISAGSGIRFARQGIDYDIPPPPLIFTFMPQDQRLPIPVNITDDDVPEEEETFIPFLEIPVGAPPYQLGTFADTTVFITDNDIAIIGFEQTEYTVGEGDGSVEVCVRVFQPDLIELIATAVIRTAEDTAESDVDFSFLDDFVDLPTIPDGSLRQCFDVLIADDSDIESTERFIIELQRDEFGLTLPNVILDPNVTVISILDDDMTTTPPTTTTDVQMGGDPHYSIPLPTGQLLCFSVQGEKSFSFNLISNELMHMNALFIQDPRREEITWIGALGIVVSNTTYKSHSNVTKIRFDAKEKKVFIGDEASLMANRVDKLTFSSGKVTISEAVRMKSQKRSVVLVDMKDVGLSFAVKFIKNHLDLKWETVERQPGNSHGLIGQFFRSGVEIDEPRKLLMLPTMDPIPVMRKPVWHFMEREVADDQLCWVAMNPGYQGKRLIEGHYLDYLVNDVLSTNFNFKIKDQKML